MFTDAWITIVDPVLNPEGDHTISRHYLIWDGRNNCAPSKKPRLVVALHGGRGNAEKMANEYLTPQGCYIVVYPSGSNKGLLGNIRVSGDNLLWNISAPYEAGWPNAAGVNDTLFITALVNAMKAQYGIDKAFVVGVSMGGMMAFRLASTTELFSAMATVATVNLEDTLPAVHIPDLHIHGTADTDISWFGNTETVWPAARPTVLEWQASDGPHKKQIIVGGVHAWDMGNGYNTTGEIWAWLNEK